jgi:TolB-like protein
VLAQDAPAATPDPAFVAVFPFAVSTEDERLRPLGRVFAELLVTDLAMTGRLRVLERTNLQMLLDEQALGESPYTDPATAARSGRLVGAGRIVQGQLVGSGDRLRANAAVVNALTGEAGRLDRIDTQGALADLFQMQRNIALMVYEQLNIALTPAEMERLGVQRTRNIEALLAFGLGLEAMDDGRYSDAAMHFRESAAADPNFSIAVSHAQRAAQAAAATGTSELAVMAAREAPAAAADMNALSAIEAALLPSGSTRDHAAEALGQEGFTNRPSILLLIIRRPQQ